ncbi:MAG TPA: hypothetical protein VD769_02875 [Gaiellaceae bacterium]|nr:hypothetical protein [Gaiellaceae bacterium]
MRLTKSPLRLLWLAVVAGLAAVAFTIPPAASASGGPHQCEGGGKGTIPNYKIGLQLFAVRADLSDQEEMLATFAELGEIGYRAVEHFGSMRGWTAREYHGVVKAAGLRIVGNHGSLNPDSFPDSLQDARDRRQEMIGSGGFGSPGFDTLEETLETAANLNMLGQQAAARNMKVFGHNHDEEFSTRHAYDIDGDGDTEMVPAIEIMIANTNPDWVAFEIDIHWARVGLGTDAAGFEELIAFLEKYSERIPLLHVKDTGADGDMSDLGPANGGTTDWPRVFRAAKHVDYYHWELDRGFTVSPMDSARRAFEYLDCLEF